MDIGRYHEIRDELKPYGAVLVAVSKTRPVADIESLYAEGQRLFGENKVQELLAKQPLLPPDIQWHQIGHLQSNKVKYIAPVVQLVESVDSLKLLEEIDRQAGKLGRPVSCLLQVHIAAEESKFGFEPEALRQMLDGPQFRLLQTVQVCGLMGMATNTSSEVQVHREFEGLKNLFEELKARYFSGKPYFKELSMGMSSDYRIALKHGATMVRIGSDIFGKRS